MVASALAAINPYPTDTGSVPFEKHRRAAFRLTVHAPFVLEAMFRKLLFSLLLLHALNPMNAWGQDKARIGIPTNTAGWSFPDPTSTRYAGIVVDLADKLSEGLGPSDVIPIPFAQLIPTLLDGKIDVIVANLTITQERAQQVAFSTPFFVGAEGLVVASGNSASIRSWEDMRGQSIGTFNGSIYVQPLQASGLFSEVRTFASPDELVAAVDAGSVAGGIGPGVSLGYLVSQQKYRNVRFVRSYEPRFKSDIAVAVRKSDPDRLRTINEVLARIRADGSLKGIFSKWGQ